MFLLVPIVRRLVILAVVLAIPLVAAELLARHFVGAAVASAIAARIGTHPHVGFGSTPILVQIVRGRLDDVTLSASGARVGGLAPLRIEASLRDV
ncbi:MAG TPA: LmeA family phospholipid-binding protein, partial [Solirubrobacteraceae bacterium]